MTSHKTSPAGVLLLFMGFMILNAGQTYSRSNLREVYQAGPLRLKASPVFGSQTAWSALFYNTFTDIVVAADGTVFAASSRQHCIFKFDSQGRLLKSFGRKGQGPGDFNGPDNLSILDDTFLVVGEYALGHRISLFDLEGHFVKLLKTNQSVYYPTALSDGKVAYIGNRFRDEGNRQAVQIQTVLIKDIDTQKEIEARVFRTLTRSMKLKSGGSISFGDDTGGTTYIARTKEGNLAVGISTERVVTLYSPEGRKIKEFPLRGKPVPVTKALIKRYKDIQIAQSRNDPGIQGIWKEKHKELENASFDHLFEDYLPLYKEILTDEEGNFLVFRSDDCFVNCPIRMEVYTPDGEYVCATEIETEDFTLILDRRRKHMSFTKQGLIALVQPKTSPTDFQLRMIKVLY